MNIAQYIIGFVIIMSSLGVVLTKKPVHACLWFLLTLLSLAAMYLQLQAPFISVMQVLVYAGAILVIFMFVIILFQDAYRAIKEFEAKTTPIWVISSATLFLIALTALALNCPQHSMAELSPEYGSVQLLGRTLYIDYFFPFEAVGLLFLAAIIGALYVGRKA